MKRLFDLLLALGLLILLLLPVLLIALAVRLSSKGPVLYWSERVGRDNVIFKMPKFRSMQLGTPAVATHLLSEPGGYLTPMGSFLRQSSTPTRTVIQRALCITWCADQVRPS